MIEKCLKYIMVSAIILLNTPLTFGQHNHNNDCESHFHDSLNTEHKSEISNNRGMEKIDEEHYQEENDELHHHENTSETDSIHNSHNHQSAQNNSGLHERIRTERIIPKKYTKTINTTGVIELARGNENVLIANSSGKVEFHRKTMTTGSAFKKGELLFTISGSDLINNNLTVKFTQVKNDFAVSKENYFRAKKLARNNIISDKELQKRKAKYYSDSTRYQILKNNYDKNSLGIKSSIDGKLYKLFVKNGEYVQEGQKLAIIHNKNQQILKIDLPKKYYSKIEDIGNIKFMQEYSDRIYNLKRSNRQKVGAENRLSQGNPYITLSYLLPHNHELIPGSFTDVWIGIGYDENSVVIPKSAIIEQQGLYYVYLKEGEEDFHKTPIKIDSFNSNEAKVLSGLHFGDQVVVKGALELKISQSNSGASSHNHNH